MRTRFEKSPFHRIQLSLVALLLVCGCAQIATQNPAGHLAGTSWKPARFKGGDGPVLTPEGKAEYIIGFGDDGAVSVRLDCNRGRGTRMSAGPNQVEFGPLALTRAMFPPGSLRDGLVKQWPYVRSYVVMGNHLFLALLADDGTFEFEPMS